MSIEIIRPHGTNPLKISGKADVSCAKELQDALIEALHGESGSSVDVAGVTACDASFVQLLFAARKSAEKRGEPFRIIGLSGVITQASADLGIAAEEIAAFVPAPPAS